MNRKTAYSIFLAFLISCPSGIVLAQLHSYGTTTYSVPDIVRGVENAAAMVFGAIAVISFVMAGILFLTAQGEAAKITAAKSAFLWGIAGVVVGILAFSIIAVVGGLISSGGTYSF